MIFSYTIWQKSAAQFVKTLVVNSGRNLQYLFLDCWYYWDRPSAGAVWSRGRWLLRFNLVASWLKDKGLNSRTCCRQMESCSKYLDACPDRIYVLLAPYFYFLFASFETHCLISRWLMLTVLVPVSWCHHRWWLFQLSIHRGPFLCFRYRIWLHEEG